MKLCPFLFPRKGVFRLFNIFIVSFICLLHSIANPRKEIISFCRNEPSFLLGSYLVSFIWNFSYVYQSSFPHEDVGKGLKGDLAKLIFKICGSNVKKITAVSEKGLTRMRKYFPLADGLVIPLMGDEVVDGPINQVSDPVKFIYIGTLDSTREFELVINAFLEVTKTSDKSFKLDIYGGNIDEWNYILSKSKDRKLLAETSFISYKGNINREHLLTTVANYDVGISLVPKNSVTLEMSPTKLSEYMSCGLAVLASSTVSSQVDVVNNANCGILTNFNEAEIIKGIQFFIDNPDKVYSYKCNGHAFVKNSFTYENRKDDFVKFLIS